MKPIRVARKAKEWRVEKVYTDYQRVLEDKEVDLVELLTPHYLNCRMIKAACQAGERVSVQKPMAPSAAEAGQMIDASEKTGVRLRVGERDGVARRFHRGHS